MGDGYRGTAIPDEPMFTNNSERVVWQALRAQMRDEDVLIASRRFSDSNSDDVEIDLLLLMPDVGAAIIEVKGGVVTYEDGQYLTRSGANGSRVIHPTSQGRRGKHALRNFLDRQPAWPHPQLLRSAWFCAFPYTYIDGDMGPEGRREQLIGSNDLDFAFQLIYDEVAAITMPQVPDSPFWVDEVVALIEGRPDIEADVAGFAVKREDAVELLTRDQARVLDMFEDNRMVEVVGPAGSGKSWIAMELARRWAASGLRVAYLTYGRGMAEFACRSAPDAVAFIGTYHQLGYAWGITAPTGAPQDTWIVEIPALMSDAARALEDSARFDAYVVDEAQDFADSWWEPLLLATSDPDTLRVAVFRDDGQEVFPGRRGHPDLHLMKVRLRENLRNARQIADAFEPLVAEAMHVRGGPGLPVEFAQCTDDVEGLASDIAVQLIEQRGWRPDQVAVLTTKSRHFLQREAQDLHGQGYWDLMWTGDDIFYSTVAGFKGLERPSVVLAVNGFHDEVEPRGVLYTGMSRARDLLIIVGDRSVVESVIGADLMQRMRDIHP